MFQFDALTLQAIWLLTQEVFIPLAIGWLAASAILLLTTRKQPENSPQDELDLADLYKHLKMEA